MGTGELTELIAITMIIFMVMPLFLLYYAFVYQNRKKKHLLQQEKLKAQFDAELIKTQAEVKEQTLQTVGADMHDNIGQLLSLTSLTLKSIQDAGPEKADQRIGSAIELLTRSIKEVRMLGKLIQGDQLVSLGLIEAIKQEIAWLEKTGAYQISTMLPHNKLPIGPDKDLMLFRIIQELLQNIIKHAKAKKISLELCSEADYMELVIKDDGVGFAHADPDVNKAGMGLANIKKRTALLGGDMQISSTPNFGTTISITLPYAPTDH